MISFNYRRKFIQFNGKYRVKKNRSLYNTFGIVNLNYDDTNNRLEFEGKEYVVSNSTTVIKESLNINQENLRWDGAIIQESVGYSLFGTPMYHAQVFKRRRNGDVVRTIYLDYWFKGPFGGYWFSDVKDIHVYKKINSEG